MTRLSELGSSDRGYVTVETVVIFPCLFCVFLVFVQLALLEIACLTTSHASVTAARSASVVLADDPRFYDSPPGVPTGKRMAEITEAAKIPLRVTASVPAVRVSFPGRVTFREGDAIRTRVETDYPCGVAIAKWLVCGASGSRHIVREATMPYQGAGYVYP